MLVNFITETERVNKVVIKDNEEMDRTIRPIYKNNEPGKIRMVRNFESFKSLDDIDTDYICKKVGILKVLLFIYLF